MLFIYFNHINSILIINHNRFDQYLTLTFINIIVNIIGQIDFAQLSNIKKELYTYPTTIFPVSKMIGQDTRYKKITNLLPQTKKIRNVSIVAHVDHGKTTIADCLISSNGIIHKKQAGQLRLLDDRLDEQDRGITMKSSSIALIYDNHLINLIDSPGHLEFYSEVSSALRLTDSSLLVVDVVEGISSQTFRVLRQLYENKLPSLLVLNKIDKLISHCQMQPQQAFVHLSQIIEQVNAVLGSFISAQLSNKTKQRTNSEDIQNNQEYQNLENKFYFSHEKHNIIFGSAIDNWGFTPDSFAPLIAKKLNKQPKDIQKYLWGEYYFNPKTKQFSQKPRNESEKPVCVDFVLKPIWDILQNVQNQNKQKIEKIITALSLKISQNTRKTYNNQLTRQLLNAWLPFDTIILKRIIQILPNPIQAQNFRLPYLLNEQLYINKEQYETIKKSLSICSHENELPTIAFVSKMVNISKNNFNERGIAHQLENVQSNRTLAFARLFSGSLKIGDSIWVINAKKKKIKSQQTGEIIEVPDIQKVKIQRLYIFNGQYPDGIKQAYAGNIIGIGGLQDNIFKSGTLSSTQQCQSFIPINGQSISVLKVSISTPNIEDNNKLLEGLKRLNKSDPSVEVYIESTGDIILNTCGQVHLEKCIVDLENIYCKIPIVTSDPIISFRQTIIWTKLDENKNQKYIMQIEKKRKQKEKKMLLQKFKQERQNDAELDQQQKEKLKAIKQWDTNVQIYESQDLTVNDIRFFFKGRQEQEEQNFSYKDEKQIKKIDHKNRGKLHTKQKFLNLNMKTNLNKQLTPNQLIWIKIKAIGINFDVIQFLEKQAQRMRNIFGNAQKQGGVYKQKYDVERRQFMEQFVAKLKQFQVDQMVINLLKQSLVCFGPNGYGSNFLVFRHITQHSSLYYKVHNPKQSIENSGPCIQINEDIKKLLQDYKLSLGELESSIKLGFDLACTSGPLCNQPMAGVVFIVEDIFKAKVQVEDTGMTNKQKQENIIKQAQEKLIQQKKEEERVYDNKNFTDSFGPLAGQIMSTVKDACIQAFVGGSPRLVEPMYLCQLQTDQQYYGSVYNQLSKRRAIIISEDLHEISNVFIIKAYLPVTQSKKFCFQLQDNSKGTINAQLRLDTWKIYNQDPFYIPLTEEEIEQDGLQNVTYNHARVLLQKVRAKKGIATTGKIVVASEKQRTLKRN